MANKFIYRGENCNLGRFGEVRTGDVLTLTDLEAESVEANEHKRFERVVAGKTKVPKQGGFIEITDKMSGDERVAAEAHNRDEQARLDQLAKANDEKRIAILDVKEKKYSELVELAEKMNHDAGRQVVDTGKNLPKQELVRRILAAMEPQE
jgi:predicted transcriptional regulator